MLTANDVLQFGTNLPSTSSIPHLLEFKDLVYNSTLCLAHHCHTNLLQEPYKIIIPNLRISPYGLNFWRKLVFHLNPF